MPLPPSIGIWGNSTNKSLHNHAVFFWGAYGPKTDEQLILIINAAEGDYQVLAVEAAQTELTKRNITQEAIDIVTLKQNKEKEEADIRANEPLAMIFKVLLFIFPAVGLMIKMIASMTYEKRGYIKKAGEIAKWTALGIGFYLMLIIVSVIFF